MPKFNIDGIRKDFIDKGALKPEMFDYRVGLDPTLTPRPEPAYFKLIYFFIYVMGVVAVLVLIYAGITYITAGADAEKSERGKKMIIGAIIGIIVIIVSYSAYTVFIEHLGGISPVTSVNPPSVF